MQGHQEQVAQQHQGGDKLGRVIVVVDGEALQVAVNPTVSMFMSITKIIFNKTLIIEAVATMEIIMVAMVAVDMVVAAVDIMVAMDIVLVNGGQLRQSQSQDQQDGTGTNLNKEERMLLLLHQVILTII